MPTKDQAQAGELQQKQRLTGWHIGTIALLAVGYAAYYFCRSDYSVALPLILAEQVKNGADAHVAEIRLGSIASLGVLFYAVAKVPAGALADRFGGRYNFLGGMAGSILFTLLCIAGGGFPLLTLAWIGNRVVQSMGWAGIVKVASRWFNYSTYGTVMGILSLSYLFGDAISREAMSLLLGAGVGWRGLFVAGAVLLGVLLVLNLVFLRESPAARNLPDAVDRPEIHFAGKDAAGTDKKQDGPGTLAIFRGLFASRAFWLVCVLSMGVTLLRETFNLWTPTYFTQFAGMTGSQAASGSALFPLFGGFSVILAGYLSDFFGASGRARILFGGLVFTVVALGALAFIPAHSGQWVSLVLVGLTAFMLIGPYSYLTGAMSLDFGGKDGGATASGIIDSAGYFAGVLSGNGMAWVVVAHGWKAFFLVLAAVAALSAVVAAGVLWQQTRDSKVLESEPQPIA